MLKPVTNITITQKTDYTSPTSVITKRDKIFFFDFCNSFEILNGWENMTTGGKIIFPKNMSVVDMATKKVISFFGKNKNIAGFNGVPILMRGDKIKIEAFYIYWDDNLNEKQTEKITVFEGYITKINAKIPVEIDVEDSMYLLKQLPMTNGAFGSSVSLETILTTALIGTDLTVNQLTTTKLTYDNSLLIIDNLTVAQFLEKLRKDAFLHCYFKGTELRVGSIVYIESEAKTRTFQFQNNIISSDLTFVRKDDIVLSAVASNHIEQKTGKTTKDGHEKTKNTRIEVLVWFDRAGKFQSKIVKSGDKPDANTDGERKTFHFLQAKTTGELIELAKASLEKYYYTGFKGSFVTFGTPSVEFGDNAIIINDLLPEQNGTYKIKAVDVSSGVNGFRQKIELDYKIK
jgi:predicted small secreted protein